MSATESDSSLSRIKSLSPQVDGSTTAIAIGVTGLVGQHLVSYLLEAYQQVIVIARRPLPSKYAELVNSDNPQLVWHVLSDFSELAAEVELLAAKWQLQGADAFTTLGTTRKQAGSNSAFKEVDYGFNYQFAKSCRAFGVERFFLLSSMGAKPSSLIFYSRIKGQLERDVAQLGYDYVYIFQPCFLLSEHSRNRPLEDLSQSAFEVVKPVVSRRFAYRPIKVKRVAQAMILVATARRSDTNVLRVTIIRRAHNVIIIDNQAMLQLTSNRGHK